MQGLKKYYERHKPVMAKQLTQKDIDEHAYSAKPGDYLVYPVQEWAPETIIEAWSFEQCYALAADQSPEPYITLTKDYGIVRGTMFKNRYSECSCIITDITYDSVCVIAKNDYGPGAHKVTYTTGSFLRWVEDGDITLAKEQPFLGPNKTEERSED